MELLNIDNINEIKTYISKYYQNDWYDHIMAVTKRKSVEAVVAAYGAGFRHFGENYIQEAQTKLHAIACNSSLRTNTHWHFIGHLQSNKAKQAVELFDTIHAVHSLKLMKKINNQSKLLDKPLNVYIALNLGDESQKSGCNLADLTDLILYTENVSRLTLKGLMCIPPATENPQPYFHKLQQIATQYTLKLAREQRPLLCSMGMSNDYKIALKEGADMVRIGSKIFGQR